MTLQRIVILFIQVLIIYSCNNNQTGTATSDPGSTGQEKNVSLVSNELIINSFGDTIKTGVALSLDSFSSQAILANPEVIHLKNPDAKPLNLKIRQLPEKLTEIKLNRPDLNVFIPGIDTSSFVLTNSTGDTIKTGVPVTIEGEVSRIKQPVPVYTQPAHRKDNARINIRYFDTEQGLNSAYVLNIVQDKRGNIWLATTNGQGAVMYNGEAFLNFGTNEGLSNNNIRCLLEDSKGNIWFGTEDGLCKYDGETITQFSEKQGLSINFILSLFEDRKGNIWIGTNNGGAIKYDGKTFTHFSKREGISNIIRGFAEDKNGNLWLSSYTDGAYSFDGKSFTQYTKKDGLSNNSIMPILNDHNGNLWFGTWGGGLTKFDGEKFFHYTEKEGLCNNNVNSIVEDKKGNLWIGTWEGLSKFDGEKFTNYTEEDGLSYNDIYSIHIDKQGILWLGTWGGGINIFNPNSFTNYSENSGLIDDHIFSVMEDKKGDMWFSSWKGITQFDGNVFNHFTVSHGLPREQSFSLFEDSTGAIWFGNDMGGLNRLQDKTLTYYREFEKLNNKTKLITEDNKGNLWIAFERNGICKFDGQNFILYDEKNGFPKDDINTIYIDHSENIWIGTEGGGLLKIAGQNLTCFSTKEGLSSNRITSIYEDSKDILWVGTKEGLNLFDGKSFLQLNKEVLSNNSIRSIVEDGQNNLWIGTEAGLNIIPELETIDWKHGDETKIISFPKVFRLTQSDGLKSNEFYPNSFCIDKNNKIWYGTSKSLVCLDLNNFTSPENQPKIQLNRIEINEQFIDFRNIEPDKNIKFQKVIPFYNYPIYIKLPAKENHLSFHFSAVNINPLHEVKYSYKISDLNKEWSLPSKENKAVYRTLPSGNHTFMVRAIGNSQIWSDPVIYNFTISPKWWNTIFAKIGYFVFLLILIIGIINWRTSRLHKKQTQLKKQIEERNQQIEKAAESDRLKSAFLATMSHEIRTPLNAIIGFSELITKDTPIDELIDFSKIINSSGIHLLSIVEDIFDISMIESGQIKLNIEKVNLKDVFESVYNIIQEEKKRINKKDIELILIFPEIKNALIETDLSKLKQILINLLKNALKYTDRGKIEFGFTIENNNNRAEIECFIKDTGIGIPKDKIDIIFERFRQVDESNTREFGGVGIGLSISKKLTEMLGGNIRVESEIGKGSEFFFTLPFNSELDTLENTTTKNEKSNSLKNQLILIVEDDKISYDFLNIILTKYDIKTIWAKDGIEAVDICSNNSLIDLVLMDLNMPKMNGYLATQEIKKFRPGLPIIAQTAYAIKGDLQKALEAGCDDYISKPIKREILISKIKESLNIRS